jgi:hypothetical protein
MMFSTVVICSVGGVLGISTGEGRLGVEKAGLKVKGGDDSSSEEDDSDGEGDGGGGGVRMKLRQYHVQSEEE